MLIKHRFFALFCILICGTLVDPVIRRQVIHPPVCFTDMIVYCILYYFQSFCMRRLNEAEIGFLPSESLIDLVMIREPVSVISAEFARRLFLQRHIVLYYRAKPDGGYAEPTDIVQVVDDPLQVAAVARQRVFAVTDGIA